MKTRTRVAHVLLVLALATPALGGCGEINSMLDAGAGKEEDKKKPEDAGSGAQSARQKLDEYYNREPRKVEQDPNDPIVPCRVQGSTQFMRNSDCELRGGRTG